MICKTIVFEGIENQRIDVFLAKEFSDQSRAMWQDFIEKGFIKVLGVVVKSKYRLRMGDVIEIDSENIEKNNASINDIKPLNLDLSIVFENENLVVINKPAGLTTHPGSGNVDNTLVNVLVNQYNKSELSNCGGIERLGIVHRLDKDTSGLIIVAKNNTSHIKLARQIETKTCKRKYLALCYGVFVPSSGNITTGIAPQKKDHRKMEAVDELDGKIAITNYRTIKVFAGGAISLVEFSLETGRTHQIRVHALHKKHPLVGDHVYFNDKYRNDFDKLTANQRQAVLHFTRQALHSFYLNFTDPISRKNIELEICLPDDMSELINLLK